MMNTTQKILCAFCRLERNVYSQRSVGWANVLLSFLAASLIMFAVWRTFDPRVVILFVIFIAMSEVFMRIRWRMSLPCPHCNFDPLLYKTNRAENVRRVKAHLEELKRSGRFLMRQNNPFLNIPVIRIKKDTGKKEIQLPNSDLLDL